MRFSKSLFALAIVSSIAMADPIKGTPVAPADKAATDCAAAFVKALKDKDFEAGMKLFAIPFRDPDGTMMNKEELEKKLGREFSRGIPEGVEFKPEAPLASDKYNDWAKKSGGKELADDLLDEYRKLIGKEGRLVPMTMKKNGEAPPPDFRPHLLIRYKDNKAEIVGLGR